MSKYLKHLIANLKAAGMHIVHGFVPAIKMIESKEDFTNGNFDSK